jgi:cytochrome P450
VARSLEQFDAWLGQHLDRLRRDPGDDLLSELVAARDEGRGLTETELKATAGLVLAAGFETTVNLLGNGIALLHDHPGERDRVVADPALWGNVVEEVLRLDPPVLLTGRMAVRDTELAGQPVRAGAMVTAILGGANRDPDVFPDPTRFDVARPNARDHIAFSAGRHHCLGAQLARMEGEVGLRAIWDRFPDLRLEPGARRRETRILRGFERLPATLRP